MEQKYRVEYVDRKPIEVDLKVEYSDRKTLSVGVHPKTGVVVKAPNGFPEDRILLFLQKHDDWIRKHVEKNEQEKHYFDDVIKGQKALYLGKKMQIVRVSDQTKMTDRWIAVKNGQNVPRVIKKLLKEEAERILPPLCEKYAKEMGVKYRSVNVKDFKSRNGCCSAEGDLTFSWRIIMTDMPLVEYVVVHELAHLKEFNHSKEFWKEVEKVIPDYKKRKKALDMYRFKDFLYR